MARASKAVKRSPGRPAKAKRGAKRKATAPGGAPRGGKVAQMDLFLAERQKEGGGTAARREADPAPVAGPAAVPGPSAGGKPPRRRETAESLGRRQREFSVSEFFQKNRHLLGFDNPAKALLTATTDQPRA